MNGHAQPIRTEKEMALLTLRIAADEIAIAIRATMATDYDTAATHITEANDLLAVALNRL